MENTLKSLVSGQHKPTLFILTLITFAQLLFKVKIRWCSAKVGAADFYCSRSHVVCTGYRKNPLQEGHNVSTEQRSFPFHVSLVFYIINVFWVYRWVNLIGLCYSRNKPGVTKPHFFACLCLASGFPGNRIRFCCTFAIFHLVSCHTLYFRTSPATVFTASRTHSVKCSSSISQQVFRVLLTLTISRLGSLFCEPAAAEVRARLCLKQRNGPVHRMSLKLIYSNSPAMSRDPFNKLRLLRAPSSLASRDGSISNIWIHSL